METCEVVIAETLSYSGIADKLDAGAMGEVYLAKETEPSLSLALQPTHPFVGALEDAANVHTVRRFFVESLGIPLTALGGEEVAAVDV